MRVRLAISTLVVLGFLLVEPAAACCCDDQVALQASCGQDCMCSLPAPPAHDIAPAFSAAAVAVPGPATRVAFMVPLPAGLESPQEAWGLPPPPLLSDPSSLSLPPPH